MLSLTAVAVLAIQDPELPRFPDFPEQDALSYALRLRVDLESRAVVGTVDYTIRAEDELEAVRLHATRSAAWHVSFVGPGGDAYPASWAGGIATVTLPEPAAPGEVIKLRASLHGSPPDGLYFRPNRLGETVAFTDHYSIRARGWLPCEDHPADRARWSLYLEYPEGSEATSFGVPRAVDDDRVPDGYDALAFSASAEIAPYMFSLVVGPFARIPEAGDPRLLPHFVESADVERAAPALVHHAEWIAVMERTFGPYAFAKYTTVQCPTRWGGFEAPGNVQLAEALFDRPDGGVGTLAHELVHMWFGDAVGYARWREVWLSEGFASYFGPWLHAQVGGPSLSESMRAQRARWLTSFEGRTKSIRDDRFPHPDQALNANTYPKGAWVLHMLRGEVGDDAFFAALRRYYMTCRNKSVVTSDFVEVVEESTGEELSWFFDQWLDRVGCPLLRATVDDGRIVVEQVQRDAPYRFWLRARWRGAGGQAVERRVRIDTARTEIPTTGTAEDLEVDPLVELLFRSAR